MKTKILCVGIVATLLVASPWLPLLWGNGGKAKNVFYFAEVSLGAESGGTCRFSIDANPVLFYFTTVNNKYQVLLIRVENHAKVPLLLSKSTDKVQLHFGTQTISGTLDLVAADRSTWDGLDPTMRETVAYPIKVEAREEEGVYVYVPVEVLKSFRIERQMPDSISFAIASLTKPADLRQPAKALA